MARNTEWNTAGRHASVYAEGLNAQDSLLRLQTLLVNRPVENTKHSIHLLNMSPDVNKPEAVAPPSATQKQNYTTIPISTTLNDPCNPL